MSGTKTPSHVMSVRFANDERALVTELADEMGMSANEVIRKAVRDLHAASAHRRRVLEIGREIIASDTELLDRLG